MKDYAVGPDSIRDFEDIEIVEYTDRLRKYFHMKAEEKENIRIAVIAMEGEGLYGIFEYQIGEEYGTYWRDWAKTVDFYFYLFYHEYLRRGLDLAAIRRNKGLEV